MEVLQEVPDAQIAESQKLRKHCSSGNMSTFAVLPQHLHQHQRSPRRECVADKVAIEGLEYAAKDASRAMKPRHAYTMWLHKQNLMETESYMQTNVGKTVKVHSLKGKLARHNDRCGTVVTRTSQGGIVVRFHDGELPRVVHFHLENLVLTRLAAPDCSPPPRSKQERGLVPNVANIPRAPSLPKNLAAVKEKAQDSADLTLVVHEQHAQPGFAESQIPSKLGPPNIQMAQGASKDHTRADKGQKCSSADLARPNSAPGQRTMTCKASKTEDQPHNGTNSMRATPKNKNLSPVSVIGRIRSESSPDAIVRSSRGKRITRTRRGVSFPIPDHSVRKISSLDHGGRSPYANPEVCTDHRVHHSGSAHLIRRRSTLQYNPTAGRLAPPTPSSAFPNHIRTIPVSDRPGDKRDERAVNTIKLGNRVPNKGLTILTMLPVSDRIGGIGGNKRDERAVKLGNHVPSKGMNILPFSDLESLGGDAYDERAVDTIKLGNRVPKKGMNILPFSDLESLGGDTYDECAVNTIKLGNRVTSKGSTILPVSERIGGDKYAVNTITLCNRVPNKGRTRLPVSDRIRSDKYDERDVDTRVPNKAMTRLTPIYKSGVKKTRKKHVFQIIQDQCTRKGVGPTRDLLSV